MAGRHANAVSLRPRTKRPKTEARGKSGRGEGVRLGVLRQLGGGGREHDETGSADHRARLGRRAERRQLLGNFSPHTGLVVSLQSRECPS